MKMKIFLLSVSLLLSSPVLASSELRSNESVILTPLPEKIQNIEKDTYQGNGDDHKNIADHCAEDPEKVARVDKEEIKTILSHLRLARAKCKANPGKCVFKALTAFAVVTGAGVSAYFLNEKRIINNGPKHLRLAMEASDKSRDNHFDSFIRSLNRTIPRRAGGDEAAGYIENFLNGLPRSDLQRISDFDPYLLSGGARQSAGVTLVIVAQTILGKG